MKNNKFLKFLLSVKGGIVISLVILLAVFSVFIFQKSYAESSDWNGYYTGSTAYSDNAAWYSSTAFNVNLGKNGTKYAGAYLTFNYNSISGYSGGTKNLYTYVMGHSIPINITSSNTSCVTVSSSSNTTKYALNANTSDTSNYFSFVNPALQVKIPRGYKYGSTTVGYNPNLASTHSWLYNSSTVSTSNQNCFVNQKGPYDQDTWTKGCYMSLNLRSIALATTAHNSNGKYYRKANSYNINFVPNQTTIKFNANGGTGSMSNQTHVYDTALTLSDNTFTRDGYTFKEWNTKENGSGTSFANKGSISATAYPTESEVTLYAIWNEDETTKGTASITYDNSSLIKSDDKVFKNDVITYKITYTEGSSSVSSITILDTLSKELEYVPNSSSLGEPTIVTNADGTSVLSFTATSSGSMTFKVKVKSDDGDRVRNSCSVSFDDDVHKLNDLINFINHKYTVKYETDKYGTLDAKSELVLEGENPRGVVDTPNIGYKTLMWKCDKPVTLSTGKVVFKNLPIQKSEITKVIVEEDLFCTVTHKIDNAKTYDCEG